MLPELRYGPARASKDSCDWFLDLPDLLVPIECKARQPIESLRTGGSDWLRSVEDSIGKGIEQINRSHRDIESIGTKASRIDTTKPRVGLVVTLEPFYIDQNRLLADRLPTADLPVGVISVEDLEPLVTLGADELTDQLRDAAAHSSGGRPMLLAPVLSAAAGRETLLLVSTWDSIPFFDRVEEWLTLNPPPRC